MFHRMDQNTSTLVSRSQKDSSGPKPTSPFHTLKGTEKKQPFKTMYKDFPM